MRFKRFLLAFFVREIRFISLPWSVSKFECKKSIYSFYLFVFYFNREPIGSINLRVLISCHVLPCHIMSSSSIFHGVNGTGQIVWKLHDGVGQDILLYSCCILAVFLLYPFCIPSVFLLSCDLPILAGTKIPNPSFAVLTIWILCWFIGRGRDTIVIMCWRLWSCPIMSHHVPLKAPRNFSSPPKRKCHAVAYE